MVPRTGDMLGSALPVTTAQRVHSELKNLMRGISTRTGSAANSSRRQALRRLGLFPDLLLDITQFLIPRIPAPLGPLLTALATPLLGGRTLDIDVARPGEGIVG